MKQSQWISQFLCQEIKFQVRFSLYINNHTSLNHN